MLRSTLLVLLALVLTPVAAQAVCWTSVASTGTVDDADQSKVLFNGAEGNIAQIDPALTPPQTAVVRYNVVAVEGALSGHTLSLWMNYVDGGSGARIVTKLKEQDFLTGVVTTLITLDSNLFPQTAAFQTQFAETPFDACSGPAITDFNTKLYFVEATMSQSSTKALKLRGVRVCSGQHTSC